MFLACRLGLKPDWLLFDSKNICHRLHEEGVQGAKTWEIKRLVHPAYLLTLPEFLLFCFQFIFHQQFIIIHAGFIFFKTSDSLQWKHTRKEAIRTTERHASSLKLTWARPWIPTLLISNLVLRSSHYYHHLELKRQTWCFSSLPRNNVVGEAHL